MIEILDGEQGLQISAGMTGCASECILRRQTTCYAFGSSGHQELRRAAGAADL